MLRVVISGVESVGKTTLARHIAGQFGGLWVPEFGRAYTEAINRPLTLQDHLAIAEGHRCQAEAAARRRPPLLVEDTDIIMTSAWARMLFGCRDPGLATIPSAADLHLLLLPDVPFVSDPVRMFGSPGERARFHTIVEEEFHERGIDPIRIGGDFERRATVAAAAIAGRIG